MRISDRQNLKTWVEISKAALENNVQIMRRLAQGKILMAVVKSNAYGHGLMETAKLLMEYGADWLGTDSLSEAIKLSASFPSDRFGMRTIKKAAKSLQRGTLPQKQDRSVPILVLGYTSVSALAEAARHKIKLTLYGPEILDIPSAFKKQINWHLKIDSGMSRQGVLLSDLPDFLRRLKTRPEIKLEGVFTHFANADVRDDLTYARQQLINFQQALNLLRQQFVSFKIAHAAATPAFLNLPESAFDLVRIGIGFYGLWPSAQFKERFRHLGLKPALSWKTRVVQVKKIKKKTPVGYGITEKVKRDSTIAVLPVGYYDGFFRGLSSVGQVLITGRPCKILGRISMNLSVADVTGVPEVKVWDEAVLLGASGQEKITAEEIAQKLGTISYEVVARINPLLPRIYTQ